jgi:hypothetical protein
MLQFFSYVVISNSVILWLSYRYLRTTARWLTI